MPHSEAARTETFDSASDIRQPRRVLAGLLRELPRALRIGFALTLRGYRTRYRANRLGYLWIVASPLLYALVFVVVREGMSAQGLRIDTGGVPPGVFALIGITLFQVWMQALLGQAESLRGHGHLAAETRLPPETYFFVPLLGSLIDLAVRLLLIAAAVFAFGVPMADTWLWAPLIALSLVVTGHAVGFLLLPFTSVYRDLQTAIRSLSLGILLISPIFYPASTDTGSTLYWINQFNPLAAGATTFRDALFGGDHVLLTSALVWTALLGGASAVWMIAMRVMYPVLSERLG